MLLSEQFQVWHDFYIRNIHYSDSDSDDGDEDEYEDISDDQDEDKDIEDDEEEESAPGAASITYQLSSLREISERCRPMGNSSISSTSVSASNAESRK
jgi:hypothetical protein